ncbi:hypothetical protein K438DRAFT_1830477 [Mycena galopus ATCC 62051]|nr:hypothetical protein K438DRAFT_1830477 [Mycena galopus ATCC 62051]
MPHRSVHPTAIVLGILLVLFLLPHPILRLLAQSTSKPQSQQSRRVEGRWVAVRHSLHLPPLAAHAKPRSNTPALSLHISSRFDLKRKRALEEESAPPRPFSFADVDAPPQLYFAADALVDHLFEEYHAEESTKRGGKSSRGTTTVKSDTGRGRIAVQDK